MKPPPDADIPQIDPEIAKLIEEAGKAMGEECFACGTNVPGGLHLHRTGHDGATAYGEFTVAKSHQGSPGIAHGGVMAAALDEILGTAAWMLGRRYVTGRLETDFLLPVQVGSLVHLQGRCTGVLGRKAYMEGEARIGGPDGPLAARASGLFIEVRLEHFLENGDFSDG